jgi:tRNA nucleotidyltransferase (CCA-adding enzyme)
MMAMTKRENTIRKIQQLSQQTMPKGAQVMLYGSQARGDAREDSDWDILIILDKPKVEQSDHDNIAFPFTMLGWELGEAIIPVIYTREEWANSSFMPFYKNVERDKIILQ